MLYVADGRDGAALDGYVDAVGEAGCEHIEMVAMDMWPAYIRSVREHTDALIALTGRRPAGEDARPVVDASREHDAAAAPGVHASAHELAARRPGVGHQGMRDDCGTTGPRVGRASSMPS